MLILPLQIDTTPALWTTDPCQPPVGVLLVPGKRAVPSSAPKVDVGRIECADDPDEDDEDLGDEEDLAVAQPTADEESSFDDFDDEFDDDFEEEENDPDWDHPDDAAPEQPPPGKGGGRKK